MLKVSSEFRKSILSDNRIIKIRCTINQKTFNEENILSVNWSGGSISGESFAIGSAVSANAKITFSHIVEGIAEEQEFKIEIGLALPNNTIEYVPLGIFIVTAFDQKRNDNQTVIEGMDKIILMEGIYTSKLSYPARIKDVALEIANLSGVPVNTVNFERLSTVLINEPVGYTFRQAIGLIAQFEAGFVSFNRQGELEIRQLSDPAYELRPTNYYSKGLTKNEVMYRVSGIQVSTGDSDNKLIVGSPSGNQIILENKIMTATLLNSIYEKIRNLNYYPFDLKWQGDPALETGDWITVEDLKGNKFKVPNLDYSLTFNGGLSAVSSAKQKSQSQSTFQSRGSLDQKLEEIRGWASANAGTWTYEGLDEPINPKKGDTWFKPNGPDTELWLYKETSAGVLEWELQTSTAGVKEAKEAADKADKKAEEAAKEASAAKNIANSAVEEATEAHNEAIETANRVNSVETIANEAKSTAGTASTNATNALSQAKEALGAYNDLEIGDRNYLLNTDTKQSGKLVHVSGTKGPASRFKVSIEKGTDYLKMESVSSGENHYRYIDPDDLTLGNLSPGTYSINLEYLPKLITMENLKLKFRAQYISVNGGTWVTIPIEQRNIPVLETSEKWIKTKGLFEIPETAVSFYLSIQLFENDTNAQLPSSVIGTTLHVRKQMLTKGNKQMDWHTAPEDVQIQITNMDNELSTKVSQSTFNQLQGTVTQQGTQITQNKSDILLKANQADVNTLTGRVSVTESSLSTQAGQITAMSSKVENNISQISTLRQDFSGLSSTVSKVKTDLDGLTFGANNLIENGNTQSGSVWGGSGTCVAMRHPFFKSGQADIFRLSNTATTEVTRSSNWFVLKPSTQYTIRFVGFAGENVLHSDVWLLTRDSGVTSGYTRAKALVSAQRFSADKASSYSVTFTTSAEDVSGLIRFDNNGSTNGASANLYFGDVVLVEGAKAPQDWIPAATELVNVTEFSNLTQTVSAIQTTVAGKAEQSQVTQMANQITSVVANVGNLSNLNMLPNTDYQVDPFISDASGWGGSPGLTFEYSKHTFYNSGRSRLLKIISKSAGELYLYTKRNDEINDSGRIAVRRNTKYTIQVSGFNDSNVRSLDIFWLGRVKGNSTQYDVVNQFAKDFSFGTSGVVKKVFTFDTGETDEGYIRIDHNGVLDTSKTGSIFITEMKMEQGTSATPWNSGAASFTQISQLATQITSVVTSVDGHTSQISQMSDLINLKVQKGDVVNQINVSTESVLISGKKIQITGDTYIASGVISTAHIKDAAITDAKIGSLSANKINAGTLDAANVNIINLNANNITSGTLKAITISGSSITGATISGSTITGTTINGGTFNAEDSNFKQTIKNGHFIWTRKSDNKVALDQYVTIYNSNPVNIFDLSSSSSGFIIDGTGGNNQYATNRLLSIFSSNSGVKSSITTNTGEWSFRGGDTGNTRNGTMDYYNDRIQFWLQKNSTTYVSMTMRDKTITVIGNWTVAGTKNSLVNTSRYGQRLLYAFETPEYLFSTFGKVTTNFDGYAKVEIEPIFLETINTDSKNYHVFVSTYENSVAYVGHLEKDSFVIKTDKPNINVSWQLVAYRKGYENFYLETPVTNEQKTHNLISP